MHSLSRRRPGVSDIVATVLIVAATLIAFAAIAGYVFGILGSGSSTANVSVISVSVNHSLLTGVLALSNTGTAAADVSGVTLTYGGTTCSPVASTATVVSGTSVAISITGVGTCSASSSSTPYTGYVSLSNGEEATFAGVFT